MGSGVKDAVRSTAHSMLLSEAASLVYLGHNQSRQSGRGGVLCMR